MLAFSCVFVGCALNNQKFVFVPLLLFGGLIYVYLIYGFAKNKDPENQHFYISSAYNIDQDGIQTTRIIALGTSSFRSAPLYCQNEHGKISKARVINVGGPLQCSWWNYFIDCELDNTSKKITLFGATEHKIQIDAVQPRTDKYKVVVCYPRMFYYENWQIALLGIEVYRQYGVQFFSIPIISVMKELYTILQHYESRGIVDLRKGTVLPRIPNLPYNPNYETEFFNQMIGLTECLYEFKQTAEFIIFGDLDDVVIPRSYPFLNSELLALAQKYPLASSLEFKWTRFNIKLAATPDQFNIENTIKHVRQVSMNDVGKSIVIPGRMRNAIMHRPYSQADILGNYTHQILDQNEAFFIHLREQLEDFEGPKELHPNAYFQMHNFDGMTARLHNFLISNITAYNTFLSLPTTKMYLPLMLACYRDIENRLAKGRQSQCPSPLICQPSKNVKQECVVLKNKYENAYIGGGLIIHKASHSELVVSNSCFIQEVND